MLEPSVGVQGRTDGRHRWHQNRRLPRPDTVGRHQGRDLPRRRAGAAKIRPLRQRRDKHHGSRDHHRGPLGAERRLQHRRQRGALPAAAGPRPIDNVIVDGLNSGDKHGIETPGDGFTLKNSEIRNIRDRKGFEGGADDMLIENNYWHHITIRTDGVHNECMYINGGDRSVYRGNLFIGCPSWPCSSPTGTEARRIATL